MEPTSLKLKQLHNPPNEPTKPPNPITPKAGQMNADVFHKTVTAEGFSEPVLIEREADGFMDVHTHPFEAKALIVQGQIEIGLDDQSQTYRAGDVFHLTALQPHWERYGEQGVMYLSARKQDD